MKLPIADYGSRRLTDHLRYASQTALTTHCSRKKNGTYYGDARVSLLGNSARVFRLMHRGESLNDRDSKTLPLVSLLPFSYFGSGTEIAAQEQTKDSSKPAILGTGHGVDHVGIAVRDLEIAKKTYRDVLGFAVFAG